MSDKHTFGLIGVGNMGTAIIEGLLDKRILSPEHIFIYDKIADKAPAFAAKTNVNVRYSVAQIIENCQTIILAIKPQDLESLKPELDFSKLPSDVTGFRAIISILAGTPLSKIRGCITGKNVGIVRAMPNLGAKVGRSITAITSTAPNGIKAAELIFSGCGETIILPEEQFDLVTAISGSGPAYFFLLMELLVKAGKDNGLTERQAQQLAVQTAVGSALLAASSEYSPEELRKQVTSKGGTTAAALEVFEKHKIADIVSEAVTAAVNRGKELAKG